MNRMTLCACAIAAGMVGVCALYQDYFQASFIAHCTIQEASLLSAFCKLTTELIRSRVAFENRLTYQKVGAMFSS